ncbi:IPT/TIG domain-containing protein [Tieghemostelium lacteum]|uniref:IPT/TIG domain-containing protein n=1 Tax=Tieghemostelium lacteum TaxID=361077 RepID=A0A152A3H7_TIELA|nr:IPT/TIG domain-containing protein [Tieghemostelium lacteum]|eukprot:KYR00754.1 IPT/TIG domain-containing protein [Tieghemostelium lacteum]
MKNYYLFILFICICICNNNLLVSSQEYTNTVNNHIYKFFNSALTSSAAINACSASTSSNQKYGYLATVTTKSEYEFIKTQIPELAGLNFWISGSQTSPGTWKYNSGKENTQNIYNAYDESCYTFCDWSDDGPVLSSVQVNVYYDVTSNRWKTATVSEVYGYVCEYGGLEETYVPAFPLGSTSAITVYGFGLNFFVGNMTVTNTITGDVSRCPMSKGFLTPDACGIFSPPLLEPGFYKASIQTTAMVGFGYWNLVNTTLQVISPMLSSIYPSGLNQGNLVTLVGKYFGTRPQNILINLSGNVACNNVSFITLPLSSDLSNSALVCELSTTISILYPISIEINTLISYYYSLPVYNGQDYYSLSNVKYIAKDYKTFGIKRSLYGMNSTLDSIETVALYQFIKNIANFQVWQSAIFNSTSITSFSRLDGTPITLWRGNSDTSQLVNLLQVSIDVTNGFFLPNGASLFYGMLISFKNSAPIAFTTTATVFLDTRGGTYSFGMTNIGSIFDSITMLINNTVVTGNVRRDFSTNSILVDFPPAPPGDLQEISFIIGSQQTPAQTKYIIYDKPKILSISNGDTRGGYITVDGTNFWNDTSLITLTMGNSQFNCRNIQFIEPHFTIRCIVPTGFGSYQAKLIVNTKEATTYTWAYGRPQVNKQTRVGSMGGLITFTGYNFYSNITQLTMTLATTSAPIVNLQCTNLTMVKPHTDISCVLSAGDIRNYRQTIRLQNATVAAVNSQTRTYNFEIPQILSTSKPKFNTTSVVQLQGLYFSDRGLAVTIGGDICSNVVYIDQQNINCTFGCKVVQDDLRTIPLNVSLTASGTTVVAGVFFYDSALSPCPGTPTPCYGNGDCINSQCKCKPPYGTSDCSQIIKDDTPLPSGGNGSSTLPGKSFNFTTAITHFREITINGTTEKLYKLTDFQWTVDNDTIPDVDPSILYQEFLIGQLENTTINMEFTIFKNEKIIQFAGDEFIVPKNSVKYNVKISNWLFNSSVNTLEIIYTSTAPLAQLDKCGRVSGNSTVQVDTANYGYSYQIKLGTSVLEAKFAQRYYYNNRIAMTIIQALPSTDPLVIQQQSLHNDSLIVMAAIKVPAFTESCTIDPSFTNLLLPDPDEDSSESNSSGCEENIQSDKSRDWNTIILATVIPVGGIAIIAAITALIVKKRKHIKSMGKLKKRLQKMED